MDASRFQPAEPEPDARMALAELQRTAEDVGEEILVAVARLAAQWDDVPVGLRRAVPVDGYDPECPWVTARQRVADHLDWLERYMLVTQTDRINDLPRAADEELARPREERLSDSPQRQQWRVLLVDLAQDRGTSWFRREQNAMMFFDDAEQRLTALKEIRADVQDMLSTMTRACR